MVLMRATALTSLLLLPFVAPLQRLRPAARSSRAACPCASSILPPPPPSSPSARASAGHVFVVHGDVLALSSDALLVPTRNLNNQKWFPSGPPAGSIQPPRETFTPTCRVMRIDGGRELNRSIWLGHLDGRFAEGFSSDGIGSPDLDWFLEAASQFLYRAYADLMRRNVPPRCGRVKHVLSMPVVGTGKGGARGNSGEMIKGLLQLLDRFVREHDADVALVVKNDRMFSAAQAHRRAMSHDWQTKLGTRLASTASDLAALARSERLCLFLGAGVSVGAGLPEWRELLQRLASRSEVPLDAADLQQLGTLGLPDQAAVVSRRLGNGSDRADDAADPDGPLASLVVDELSSSLYSITHGLLAGLPVSSVVTTNYDDLFERAWRAADAAFNVLPYETEPSDRFILKLHGDVYRPQDIVLTRSQMLDVREQRKALSGIVQSMLLTKHLLFVGFSLQDPNFSEVAGTVRRALQRSGQTLADEQEEPLGTLLTLHNRPFLSELWPELRCLPMDLSASTTSASPVPDKECARLLEIMLDKVSLDSSTCRRHLLDPDFSGAFTPEDAALKARLGAFRERLAANSVARKSSGFSIIQQTLQRLGDRGGFSELSDDAQLDA